MFSSFIAQIEQKDMQSSPNVHVNYKMYTSQRPLCLQGSDECQKEVLLGEQLAKQGQRLLHIRRDLNKNKQKETESRKHTSNSVSREYDQN